MNPRSHHPFDPARPPARSAVQVGVRRADPARSFERELGLALWALLALVLLWIGAR